MATANHHPTEARDSNFPPLEIVTSPTVTTAQAAHYLNRAAQTLRIWSMGRGNPPIMPLRIGGRLAWPTQKLRELTGVAQ